MPNGCSRNTMKAPATSLSLTPPLHSSLYPKPKHQKQQHTPHIAFQVQENTPHAQNAQSSAIFPGSGDLVVVAVHPRTNLSSAWWASPSSPPATRTADAAPASVPHHRSNTKLRRPGDVDAGVLPPLANNHHLRRSLDLAASVSLLGEHPGTI
uniref:Uncharacterized protein n=1 Tax=Oryza barthii TaxID=65489 RepID=A0A0D3GH42_9ORYZ